MELDRREMLGLIAALSVAHLPSLASAGPRSLTHSIALPTAICYGDILFLAVCSEGPEINLGPGWTVDETEIQENGYAIVAHRIASGSDSPNFTLQADRETHWDSALYQYTDVRGCPELRAVSCFRRSAALPLVIIKAS